MSNVINKVALLEHIYEQAKLDGSPDLYWIAEEIESGTFDIPTDKKRCHLCPDDAETCYCYDDKPSVDADAKEIDFEVQPEKKGGWSISVDFLKELSQLIEQGDYPEESQSWEGIEQTLLALKKTKWWSQLLAKLAEKEAEDEAKVNHFYAVNRGLFAERDALQAKLNQAVEALEYYARCRECGGKGYFEIPTGVEHSGIQEMRKEPCECHIAKAALQSIKGEDKNA